MFALGASGNPRKIAWSDLENNTIWTPASTNLAGSLELQTGGKIITAKRVRGQVLVLTDIDAHIVSYVGQVCIDPVTVASGENLAAGAVVGLKNKLQAAAPIPTVVGTGNGAMSALSFGPGVLVGSYVVKCTAIASNSGTFSVTSPSGVVLGSATVGTAFVSDEIRFLISDGGTDFAQNDTFTVVVTAGGTPVAVGTGIGAMSAISAGQKAENGTYIIKAITAGSNAATFSVTSPSGNNVGTTAALGTAFASSHVNFNIADGTTDFIVGDYFNILIAAGISTGAQAVAWKSDAVDGSQNVSGVLLEAVNATSAVKTGAVLARYGEVNASELVWRSGYNNGQKASGISGLKALGIVARATDGQF
jgi:hypothetical protein